MNIKLYLKMHPNGKIYFGKTIQDVYTYKGSGTEWNKLLNDNSEDRKKVKTILVGEFEDPIQARNFAIQFSKNNNIVGSDIFCNAIIENAGVSSKLMGPECYKTPIREHNEIMSPEDPEDLEDPGLKPKSMVDRPYYSPSSLWLGISRHLSQDINKNKLFYKEFRFKNRNIVMTNTMSLFSQKDKLIFEMVLYQWSIKKYPDVLQVDLYQLASDMEMKPHKHKMKYLFDRLEAFSHLRVTIARDSVDFSAIRCTLDISAQMNITIDFKKLNNNLTSDLFPHENKIKKYVIPFIGEYTLLISEFLQLKTTMLTPESKKTEHPFKYRYRNFTLESILDYMGLLDKYNTAGDFFHDDEQLQMRQIITKNLTKLYKYGKKNNIPIPRYRFNPKNHFYEIKDFNYPDPKTNRELLQDLANTRNL